MKKRHAVATETPSIVEDTTETISEAMQKTEDEIERVVTPVRKEVLRRFPVLFILLVTLGATATISGMEQLLMQINFLQSHPTVVFIIGISLLVFTGTLYKKLG